MIDPEHPRPEGAATKREGRGARLSQSDVARLLHERSAETRASTAEKVAGELRDGDLTEAERRLAEEVVRALARDAEVRVREALARMLKDSQRLPYDVAVALARDVDSVALPVIEFSRVLTNADLMEIVRGDDTAKQVAVARRPQVCAELADALVETDNEAVVTALVANGGADIPEPSMQRVLDRFGDSEPIKEAMVGRRDLQIAVAERLVGLVSDKLAERLLFDHRLGAEVASDLVLEARERATLSLVSGDADPRDVETLVRELHAHGRLTPSIVIRSVCLGDLTFFETALAALAGIPPANAHRLVEDVGLGGLKALFEAAGMPPALFPTARIALGIARETDDAGEDASPQGHMRRVIERLLSSEFDLDPEAVAYLERRLAGLG